MVRKDMRKEIKDYVDRLPGKMDGNNHIKTVGLKYVTIVTIIALHAYKYCPVRRIKIEDYYSTIQKNHTSI